MPRPSARGRPFEHGRLAEHDPLGKDAVVAGEHRRRQGHGDDAEHGSGRPPRTHCYSPRSSRGRLADRD